MRKTTGLFLKSVSLALMAGLLSSCFIFRDSSSSVPVQTPVYHMGPGEISSAVRNIDISWLDGMVDVIYYDGLTVKFFEASDHYLSNETTMYHHFDGSTLYIRYGREGSLTRYASDKKLTLLLPSGSVYRNFSLQAVSSSVFVDVDATYNKIRTVDGDVRYSTMASPSLINIATESGPMEVILPQSSSFKLVTATGSGKFTSDFNLKRYSGYYLYGSGYSQITLDSKTGAVELIKAQL